jgi:hypothetical protein
MNVVASADRRRWIVDSIAVYVDDQDVAALVVEAVKRHAGAVERMGVFQLDNGNRVAWVRFEDRNAGVAYPVEGGQV